MLVQMPEEQTPGKAHSSRSGADSSWSPCGPRRTPSIWRGRNLPTPLASFSELVRLSPGPWGRAGPGSGSSLGQPQHPLSRMLLGQLYCQLPSCLCDSLFLLCSPLNLGIMIEVPLSPSPCIGSSSLAWRPSASVQSLGTHGTSFGR